MKKIAVVAAALVAMIGSGPARADLSLENFQRMSIGKTIDRQSVEMYVGGVVKGYLNANGYLRSVDQAPLFCYAGDITTGEAKDLTAQAVSAYLAVKPGDAKKEMTELLILMKLKAMYPCKT